MHAGTYCDQEVLERLGASLYNRKEGVQVSKTISPVWQGVEIFWGTLLMVKKINFYCLVCVIVRIESTIQASIELRV